MCDHKGRGCQRARCHSTSTIKAKPSKPEQGRAQKGHGQVVGRHRFVTIPLSLADHEGCCQCGNSRADMNNKSSRKIKSTEISDPATHPPDPVRKRIVDKCCPEDEKDKIGLELKSFSKRDCDQCRRNPTKHNLKDNKSLM